jgi:hypothetical protein
MISEGTAEDGAGRLTGRTLCFFGPPRKKQAGASSDPRRGHETQILGERRQEPHKSVVFEGP